MSWQSELSAAVATTRERERDVWLITATDPPTFTDVWASRTRDGVVGTDLAIWSTCYEFHVIVESRNCEDGSTVWFRFDPPVEHLRVRRENMTNVVSSLKASGYHARCSGSGGTYEF